MQSKTGRMKVAAMVGVVWLAFGTLAASPVSAQDGFHLVPLDEAQFVQTEGSPVELAVLWGDPTDGPVAFYLKLPAGFPGGMHFHSEDYHAVVVSGQHSHWLEGEDPGEANGPGTYYFQPGGQLHQDANFGDEEVILFIFFPVGFDTTFVE